MKRNTLIVIEGGDAAGKKTQSNLLVRRFSWLKKIDDVSVEKFDFPRYDSPTGRIIGRALKGSYGDFRHLHPHLASAIYTVDRAAAKPQLEKCLAEGVVICDRYTPSNIAFQSAKLDQSEREEFIRELEEIEYEDVGLPRPTVVVFLDVPVEISKKLAKERGELDQHESDIEYQEQVAQVYRDLSSRRSDWIVVKCVEDGVILSPEKIHERVIKAVEPFL
jgi:dTMP kinase